MSVLILCTTGGKKICFSAVEEENDFFCSSEVEGYSVAGSERAIPL